MLDAADYIRREGRRDARRAIVILTDDRTEFDRDDEGVGRALARANAVMCALIAPDAMPYNRGGGQRPGGWGGGGGGLGGGLGGVIFGGPRGGGGYPGGGGMGGQHNQSAGTSEIARDSGGDSMSVNDASSLEDTLERLRRRYTLYFSLPDGVQPGQERNIEVDLAPEARRRFADAEVRYRRTFQSSNGGSSSGATQVTRAPIDSADSTPASSATTDSDTPTVHHRHVAVNEDGTAITSPDPQQ